MYGRQYSGQLDEQQNQEEKLRADTHKLNTANTQLKQRMSDQSADGSMPIDDAFSKTLIGLRRDAGDYGVSISAIAPHKKIGSSGLSSLQAMTEQVPSTSVKSVRINIRGSYTDYEGFMHYLTALKRYPVAIVFLKITGKSYELGIRIYGQ